MDAGSDKLDRGRVGIHAFKDRRRVEEESRGAARQYAAAIVLGSISMWGTVIEHDAGYRAQFAKVRSLDGIVAPVRLFERLREDRLLEQMRALYGVSAAVADEANPDG